MTLGSLGPRGTTLRLEPRPLPNSLPAAVAPADRVLIRKADRWLVVRLAEVDWIGGAGNYVELHVGAARHLYRQTLCSFANRCDARRFVRIHRSTIVNLDRVAELRPTTSGRYDVTLRDGCHLTLSRRYRRRVLELVGRI